jgi:hypothetical protein
MGVDHRCHRVGGVVESIDELEAERDEERYPEKKEGEQREAVRHGPVDIIHQAVACIADPNQQQDQEQENRPKAGLVIERGSGGSDRVGGNGLGGNAADGAYSSSYREPPRL